MLHVAVQLLVKSFQYLNVIMYVHVFSKGTSICF